MGQPIYFDNMANTPVDPRVAAEMAAQLTATFGNPLNLHDYGQKSAQAIETARANVAKLIGAGQSEIIFTSCASESNNLAIKGLAKAYPKKGNHIITSSIEHFSVLYPLRELEKEGFSVTYLPVDKYGLFDSQAVAKAITDKTILVSLTHASNEIGTIEPIAEIGQITKAQGIVLHVDATQTAGTVPVNIENLGVDALTLAANMFYGPTGIAALYLRKGTRIIPQLLGGTQEEGKRAGTNNLPGIVGLGRAAELAMVEMGERARKLIPLRDKLIRVLPELIKEFYITGHPIERLPGHASGYVKYVEGESMSMFLNMEGIAISTGSACVSKALKASHVVVATGVSPEDVHGSLVFSLGKDNTEAEVDLVIEKLPPIVARLRAMSPLSKK